MSGLACSASWCKSPSSHVRERGTRVAKGVPCDRQIDNLLTTYKIGKRHKVLCMANLTRHKLPVWVWFRRQRSGLGDVTVTTFRFGCGYGDNVPVWVRLRRQRSEVGRAHRILQVGSAAGTTRCVGDIRAARREEGRVEQKVKSSEMCPRTNHSSSRENTSKSINTKNHKSNRESQENSNPHQTCGRASTNSFENIPHFKREYNPQNELHTNEHSESTSFQPFAPMTFDEVDLHESRQGAPLLERQTPLTSK